MIYVAIAALAGVIVLAMAGWIGVGRVRASLNTIRTENTNLRTELQNTRTELAESRSAVTNVVGRIEKHDGRIRRVRDDLTESIAVVAGSKQGANVTSVADRQDGLVRLANELREEIAKTKRQLAEQREQSDELRSRIATVRTEMTERQQGQSRLNTELRTGIKKTRITSRHVSRLSGQDIHGSVRALSDDSLESLLSIAPKLGLDWMTDRQLRYMEHAVVALEGRLRGRLAAPVEAMILRAMVAMAAPRDDAKILEIGTLYGLSSCYFNEVVKPQKLGFHQTIIDPFLGYYEQGAPDLFTPIPITEAVAIENLSRVGATPSDYEIVVGLSEDPEVLGQFAHREFDVVVIDGDHSYDGVRRDFENYAGNVISGGFVIVDDYRGPSWPDVTKYVDETVFTDPRFEVVTGELRTAVVRRTS